MKIPQTKRYSIYKKLVLQDERSKKLNFEPDNRKHYVYRVTDYTRTGEKYYYGSRTSKKDNIIEDFWSYKTSSKYNILNENKKENYKVKIIKVFDNSGEKYLYEAFLHQYFNVKDNITFWNKCNSTPFGYSVSKSIRKEIGEKIKRTKSNPKWKLDNKQSFINGKIKELRTKNSEKWKNTIGKQQINDYKKWLNTGDNKKVRDNKIKETLNSEEWKRNNLKKKIIFDDKDNIIFEFYESIKKFCKLNDLPYRSFERSLNDKSKLYSSKRNSKIKIEHYEKYKGWYIRYED